MAKVTTDTLKPALRTLPLGLGRVAEMRKYDAAWEQLERLSARLKALWKTKKNTLQLLREERAH